MKKINLTIHAIFVLIQVLRVLKRYRIASFLCNSSVLSLNIVVKSV